MHSIFDCQLTLYEPQPFLPTTTLGLEPRISAGFHLILDTSLGIKLQGTSRLGGFCWRKWGKSTINWDRDVFVSLLGNL